MPFQTDAEWYAQLPTMFGAPVYLPRPTDVTRSAGPKSAGPP